MVAGRVPATSLMQVLSGTLGLRGPSPRMTRNDKSYRIRRTLVTSLPAARMRAIASVSGSSATAMWKALA